MIERNPEGTRGDVLEADLSAANAQPLTHAFEDQFSWALAPGASETEKTAPVESRVLTEADRGAAVAIWEAVGLTRPWNQPVDDFHRALAGPTSTVLGVFDDEELVATIMVGHDGHRGWVYYLAVQPSMQGQGLGSRMMQDAEGWLRELGVVKLNLMVRHSNSDALRFYKRLGYEDAEVTVLERWLT